MVEAEPDDQGLVEEAARAALARRFPERVKNLEAYAEMLRPRGIEWGLLGPREAEKVWSRHISNSLALVDVLGLGTDVADVGSGAGLPGIPLALCRDDLRMTLLEPLLRRHNFLTLAVEELGLGERVRVERLRAEDCDETFDVVICRAVAPLEKLLKWTTPMFFPDGELLALKGVGAESEIETARKRLNDYRMTAQVLHVYAAPGIEGTRAIRVLAK